ISGQDYFDIQNGPIPRQGTRRGGLIQRVEKIVNGLPSSALDSYQLQYGPLAQRTLQDALQNPAGIQWDGIAEVRRKFFHTNEGIDATHLLAQRDWQRGRIAGARLKWLQLCRYPRALNRLGDAVVGRAAMTIAVSDPVPPSRVSGIFSGQPIAEDPYGQLLASTGRQSIRLQENGRERQISTADDLADWASAALTKTDRPGRKLEMDHPISGGAADRNGNGGGQMPLWRFAWKTPTLSRIPLMQKVQQIAEGLQSSGEMSAPSLSPIVVPGRGGKQTVLMRTEEKLLAFDLQDGIRVWDYPSRPATQPDDVVASSDNRPGGFDVVPERLQQRLWNDLPYGKLSSDGQRVFLVDDLRELQPPPRRTNFGMVTPSLGTPSQNSLVACELATEGKLLWTLGANGDRRGELAGAFFL
ncbi:MAG: hypothetical protein AAFP69_23575, partial [Planctomycetota bacterium]